jgi:class 3 adenylate cyclase
MLSELEELNGNPEAALKYHRLYKSTADSILNADVKEQMLQSSMEYEFDKKEAETRAEQEKKDIRQRNIRNSIIAGLIGALIFGVVVYRQRNKIAKEKQRSEELLLNILPGEVAEELKAKGSADAKQFDEISVMFTDFKGFTQIAEQMSPGELVAEIDVCFKAFDGIITRNGLEKIKTIGDSYMCAGGLPVPTADHAEKVVKAALEIQDFMEQHQLEREGKGKARFEARIGIHTGPVVAGIVGVKKFAYDIWGDTVNIASRMESSGEAGEVNISGSTYSLVKDKFMCQYRGKVEAKNKGEIDMYFVAKG